MPETFSFCHFSGTSPTAFANKQWPIFFGKTIHKNRSIVFETLVTPPLKSKVSPPRYVTPQQPLGPIFSSITCSCSFKTDPQHWTHANVHLLPFLFCWKKSCDHSVGLGSLLLKNLRFRDLQNMDLMDNSNDETPRYQGERLEKMFNPKKLAAISRHSSGKSQFIFKKSLWSSSVCLEELFFSPNDFMGALCVAIFMCLLCGKNSITRATGGKGSKVNYSRY